MVSLAACYVGWSLAFLIQNFMLVLGEISDKLAAASRVSQKSNLGSLLFIMYINGITVRGMSSKIS